MKRTIFFGFVLVLGAIGVACDQNAGKSNTSMNHSGMNHNQMNHNAMPMDHSKMDHSNMNHANMNHSGMNHGEMNHSAMKSDPNAANAPFDLQFIDTMTHHHEGAVQMAEIVLKKSQNEQLKKFAQNIIGDQGKEIAQMKQWREKWFAGSPAAKNMEMTGMADSAKMMSADEMKNLESASGKEFDIRFLDMMIPHHRDAVTMSQEALQKSEKAEIKTLANEIIKAQETEIKQMNDWKAQWSK